MRRALALAARGEGLTRPNPPVGAVVVKNGRVLGEGWHRKAGGPHAEVFALRAAGKRAAGATLYVTLEPCSTHGRTPPCTDAILAAGIARVVAAVKDPNPSHAGRGLRLLSRNGVQVDTGICAADAARLLGPFAARMLHGRPFVTLKLAVSLDGRIADARGRSKWITGPAARARVHALRRRADAILVGAETVRADDPSLLPRPSRGRNPMRVVVSQTGNIPASARLLTDEASADTLIAVPRTLKGKSLPSQIPLPASRRGVSLPALMRALAKRGIMHVLCEGGGGIAAALLDAGLVDELQLFVAPIVLGGRARPAVGGEGWLLASAPGFAIQTCECVGRDVLITARRT